jgi:RNA polymerase sigma-70 factor (ECF subfamily)
VSLPSFRGRRPGSGSAWLWGIARNLVRQHYRTARLESASRRRLGIEPRSYGGEEVDEVVARASAAARAAEIAAALDGLSPEQRSALQLRVVDDLDFGAVSEYLRISQPAARMRVSRALALLRSRFREGVT